MEQLRQAVRSAAVSKPFLDETGAAVGRYRFDEEFAGFRGHFPERPLLPAVVQIMAALHVAEEVWKGVTDATVSVDKAKFTLPIVPGDEVEVRCVMKRLEGGSGVEARVFARGEPASSFILSPVFEE
ncbi:MAG: 3-hydroxyacyl-ACP dehydratase FabZ family protein [Thermodesulfobacteriota bacterium]